MKRILTGAIALAMAASFAAPVGAASIADIQAQIAALTAQLSSLSGGSSMSSGYTFTADLTIGSKGADVTALQTWLISKGFSIPAGATGYFGAQTKSAVAAWQTSAGITPAAGYFGPKSRAAVNAMGVTTTTTTSSGSLCPNGMTLASNCTVAPSMTTTTTVTGASSLGSITTPGVEGILTVTSGPISNSVVNVGQKMVPILTLRAQAQNSDIAIERITLDLGTNTNIYNKIYQTLYIVDKATGQVLASTPLNSSTVVQSGSVYVANIAGFSDVVARGTYKDIAVEADVYPSVNTPYLGTYTVSVDANGVRGTDGAGIDQYGPASGSVSQGITLNASLIDNSIANISLDSTSPQANSIPVTDTTNGQYLQLPILTFDIGAQNDSVHIHNLSVQVLTSGTGSANAAYLYQGSTLVTSAAISGGFANFTNIQDGTAGASVPVNTTLPYTVKVDVTGVTSGTLTVNASTSNGFSGTTLYNSQDGSVNTVNGSATGNTQTVLGKGPAFTIQGVSIASSGQNVTGSSPSTSTITATFSVGIQAIGTPVYFGTQASTTHPMFTFKVFNGAGTAVAGTALMGSSSGFIVPTGTGFITTGIGPNSFMLPQQQSGTLSGITFSFGGKDNTGQPLTAGPYSVEISGITYSNDNGATYASQTYMDGLTNWRTAGVNAP